MLAMPAPTAYDLTFRLLGITVRVHPLFWLVAAMLGGLGREGVEILQVLVWTACVFVSILVHEYGHGLTAAAFGSRSRIALHAFGGLCASEGGSRTRAARLTVILMGPAAGFLFFGLAVAAAYTMYGVTLQEALALARIGPAETARAGALKLLAAGELPYYAFSFLFFINLLWGLVNLLPVWPLDGGQAAAALLDAERGRGGMATHVVSLGIAGALGVAALVSGRWWPALLCGLLAATNYQYLKAYGARAAR